ncbi:hypothetical protein J7E96_16440 [Streptomyces sp. ISL-96]|uniref:hypothetical protein n=1 Tax=Streptomyces sp. ISL-96 TaxID=2819191 RepID=UPI001BE7BE8C|nr:hypothetical protein [Streptomyces sp. ISL-96]MBT2490079.1 hypothetical protein [Streptomyces sp. ISL-96]
MAARAHTRPHTPVAGHSAVDIRLRWWAVALPALAFAVLLLLIAGPGEAHAATGDPTVADLLERIQQALSH